MNTTISQNPTSSQPEDPKPLRTAVYVDGFNLYFGMKEGNYSRFYWLNIHALATSLLEKGQQLVAVKYFTSRVTGPRDKVRRQTTYLEAIQTTQVVIFEGKFQAKPFSCNNCRSRWTVSEEKMTDVNIATEMLTDAFTDRFDRAVLVSGDSDLVPPIKVIRNTFEKKSVIVAFPPRRNAAELKTVSSGSLFINHQHLSKCQFPDEVSKSNGHILHRPDEWK